MLGVRQLGRQLIQTRSEDFMSLSGYVRNPGAATLLGFGVLALVLIPNSGFGQSDSNPKVDVFAGYQWLHPGATVPMGNPSNPTPFKVPDMPRGFGAAVTYNFDRHWGAEFDFGHNWAPSDSETTVSGGPRFIWRTDDANYFLHALLSYNHLGVNGLNNGGNGIGAILGGGLDLPITKTIAFRLFEADYVWARHNYAQYADPQFSSLRRPSLEGVRLRTGLVFSWGGAEEVAPAASCSVQPTEVIVGEPITATVTPSNFNPKHTVTYSWSGNGGQVTGKDTSATIDTNNLAPGNYTVTARVTDPKTKKNNQASCTANFTVKPLPPKNPPTMSLSASPSSIVTGGSVNVTATCSSPDGVPVSVANYATTAGSISGVGNSATLTTSGAPAGPVTVTATCTDARGLSAQGTTQVTLENPPPPPVDKALEARLALHSIYFPTAQPPVNKPDEGLVPSQQKTLMNLATDFKKYLEAKPDAHLVLEGHADLRGSVAYNQALSERRVARVKSYLIEQGVPESKIDTKAFGKERNLTLEEVKASVGQNPELTTEERKRAMARINVIKLASNRRVDVTLSSAGQTETSVRQFPFNAADAMSLIGGRESEIKKTTKPAPRKKPAKKQ
jgi:outer membrane protein OmpA-like peptidoglycan-associated protein